MAGHMDIPLAARSRSAPKVVSPRNKVNVAFPFSRFTVQEQMKMTAGDWVSLAGLVISVMGFGVVIWQSIRAANASGTGQAAATPDFPPRTGVTAGIPGAEKNVLGARF